MQLRRSNPPSASIQSRLIQFYLLSSILARISCQQLRLPSARSFGEELGSVLGSDSTGGAGRWTLSTYPGSALFSGDHPQETRSRKSCFSRMRSVGGEKGGHRLLLVSTSTVSSSLLSYGHSKISYPSVVLPIPHPLSTPYPHPALLSFLCFCHSSCYYIPPSIPHPPYLFLLPLPPLPHSYLVILFNISSLPTLLCFSSFSLSHFWSSPPFLSSAFPPLTPPLSLPHFNSPSLHLKPSSCFLLLPHVHSFIPPSSPPTPPLQFLLLSLLQSASSLSPQLPSPSTPSLPPFTPYLLPLPLPSPLPLSLSLPVPLSPPSFLPLHPLSHPLPTHLSPTPLYHLSLYLLLPSPQPPSSPLHPFHSHYLLISPQTPPTPLTLPPCCPLPNPPPPPLLPPHSPYLLLSIYLMSLLQPLLPPPPSSHSLLAPSLPTPPPPLSTLLTPYLLPLPNPPPPPSLPLSHSPSLPPSHSLYLLPLHATS
ncbi:hypothetical protein C7M84_015281, partial [Penaeus vannamei]